MTARVLLLCLLAACGADPRAPGAGPNESRATLEGLIIDPAALPGGCSLTWISKPLFFEPTEQFPDDFAGFVVGQFLLPPSAGVDLRNIVAGVSNVYSSAAVEHAVVNMSLVFASEESARLAHQFLSKRYSGRVGAHVVRQGQLVSSFVAHPSVSVDCAVPLWQEISSRTGAAA